MRKGTLSAIAGVLLTLASLAGCSAATGSSTPAAPNSPAAATSSPVAGVTTSAPAPASSSTFITGGPPSSTAPATGNAGSAGRTGNAVPSCTPNHPADVAKFRKDRQAFFALIQPCAVAAMRETRVPASITMAVAADASSYGNVKQAAQANNLYSFGCGQGRTCSPLTWTNPYTQERKHFAQYPTWRASILDFTRLISTAPAYASAMREAGNVRAFALALSGTYSGDPEFGSVILSIIKMYHLQENDVPSATS